jgi:hypothetical protein
MEEQRARKKIKHALDAREPPCGMLGIETWYDEKRSKSTVAPTKIGIPEAHAIHANSERYRAHGKLRPYKDASGIIYPINHIRELVPAANRYLKQCERGRAFKTYYENDTHKPAPPPAGMHIFAAPVDITEDLTLDALKDMNLLYKDPKYKRDPRIHMLEQHASPTNSILFYSRDHPQPSFMEVIRILRAETPRLAEYVMIYFNIVRGILGTDDEEMERVSLTLVHYDSKGGLNPHIDTVHLFGDTLGPIFSVAMGDSLKMLDMLPVLLPATHAPTRLFSKQNEIMVMDGESRILWAHAKPWLNIDEQFTLVFKFPELRKKVRTESYVFEDTLINIPYYVE